MGKTLKITDILAQKEALKKRGLKQANLYVPSLDAEVTVIEPTRAQIMELSDMTDDGNDYLVYQCIVEPNLKDNHAELMKEFECAQPHEVVQKIFRTGEVAEIAVEILKLAGLSPTGSGVKLVDAVKN